MYSRAHTGVDTLAVDREIVLELRTREAAARVSVFCDLRCCGGWNKMARLEPFSRLLGSAWTGWQVDRLARMVGGKPWCRG
jgi:hypothetical protein